MKKIITPLLVITMCLPLLNFAAGADSIPTTSTKPQQVEIKIAVANEKDSSKTVDSEKNKQICENCNAEKVKGIQWVLVFLPTILFLLLFYYFMNWLKKDGFKVADALSTCDPVTLKHENKDAAGNITVTTEDEVLPKSSSRMIAFLTALSAITISVCLITYYIFITLAGCPNPELDDLWKVIASLGIGVIPYGANMWKESKKENQ